MFQGWRMRLREAELAYRRGQLDEASRLLCDQSLREFLPAQRLLERVAGDIARRGEEQLNVGQTSAGWRDLDMAARLGAGGVEIDRVREQAVGQMLAEVETYLAAGDYRAANSRLDEIERRGGTTKDVRRRREISDRMAAGRRLMRRGKFAEAQRELAVAHELSGGLKSVADWSEECKLNAGRVRELSVELHGALADENWQRALTSADAILELAPDDRQAREARQRAWQAVGMQALETFCPSPRTPRAAATHSNVDSDMASQPTRGERLLLWVDAVGGYLVCLDDTITLGQPVPGSEVDVPLLADLSRLQARIRRDGEGYLLDPVRTTRLAGQLITELAPLADGALIELGSSVKLRFRQPHALSATARLELASRHRTQPSADGVVLMAESCVLGPGQGCHIVCPDWSREVVIYRQEGELFCRTTGSFTVDGVEARERSAISRSSTVVGPDFSFTLEAL